jgi:hypothetical protein
MSGVRTAIRALPGDTAAELNALNREGRAVGGPVAAGTPYLVNENTPRSEVFVPSTSGHVLTNADAVRAIQGAAGVGSSQTVNVNVYNPSPEPASTSTRRELRKLALTGSPK